MAKTTKPKEEVKPKVKKKNGRPRKEVSEEQVYRLGLIHCTVAEIASVLKCSQELINKKFIQVLHRGWEEGQMSMKRKMHEIALGGDVKMLIWLSKQRLGYKDQMPVIAAQTTFNIITQEVPSGSREFMLGNRDRGHIINIDPLDLRSDQQSGGVEAEG